MLESLFEPCLACLGWETQPAAPEFDYDDMDDVEVSEWKSDKEWVGNNELVLVWKYAHRDYRG